MIGWRFWLLLAVALGGLLWATSSLIFLEEAPPLPSAGRLLGPGGDAEGRAEPSERIREESREAMRDLLREEADAGSKTR